MASESWWQTRGLERGKLFRQMVMVMVTVTVMVTVMMMVMVMVTVMMMMTTTDADIHKALTMCWALC